MILRLWRAPVEAPDVEPFRAFLRENLYPTLERGGACRGMTTAVDRSVDPPEVVAASVWSSREALADEAEGVFLDEARTYLAGPPRVEHHEVLDHATW